MANRSRRTVAWQDGYIVPERVKLFADPAQEQVTVAPGQIPPATPAGKQRHPDQQFVTRKWKQRLSASDRA